MNDSSIKAILKRNEEKQLNDLEWLCTYWNADDDTRIKMLFEDRTMVSMAKLHDKNSPKVIIAIEQIESYETL